MQKEGLSRTRAAEEEDAERLKKREQSGSRRGSRADEEAGGEVRHTHFVYKRNARAGKWRKRAEGGAEGSRAEERKRREAERKRREGAEGGRAEAEGGGRGQQSGRAEAEQREGAEGSGAEAERKSGSGGRQSGRAEAEGGRAEAEGGASMGYRECREAWLSHFQP